MDPFHVCQKLVQDSNGALVVNLAYSAWVSMNQCLHSLINLIVTKS